MCIRRYQLLVVLLLCVATIAHSNGHYVRAPCVFRGEDSEMHKYAAVLAATEPFKESCQRHVLQSVGPLKRLSLWIKGGPILKRAASLRDEVEAVDVALNRYEDRVSKALSAYGLAPEDFNELSKMVSHDPSLRRKVNLQAYYYKIAGDLQFNLNHGTPELPKLAQPSLLSSLSASVASALASLVQPPVVGVAGGGDSGEVQLLSPLQKFARAAATIEAERMSMRNTLKEELGLRDLPERMSDPALQAAFSPRIRRMSAAFPRVAQSIIAANDLDAEQFEDLQRQLEKNPLFRMRVQQEIRRLEKQRDA